MNRKKYRKLLKDYRWYEKRMEILERDNFTCQCCGIESDNGVPLNVHHRYYIEGRMPWQYPNSALIILCDDCHKRVHHEHDENFIDYY